MAEDGDVKPAEYDVMALYSPSDVKSVMENFKPEELPVIATFGEATLRAALDAGMNRNFFKFQRSIKLVCIDTIVFNGISITNNFYIL